jgi:hypothetical protein
MKGSKGFQPTKGRMGYTLKDSLYFDGLKLFTDELNRRGFPYAVVGGCGSQIWLAKAICSDRPLDLDRSVMYVLRPTKDMDLISTDPDAFYQFMADMPDLVTSKSGLELRQGPSNISLKRGKDRINMQYIPRSSGLDTVYDHIVDEAVPVSLIKGSTEAQPHVARPEHIVAAKLTQASNREKHHTDVFNMFRVLREHNRDMDDEEIRTLLKAVGKEYAMDSVARVRHSLG